jgi:hypothetical protein
MDIRFTYYLKTAICGGIPPITEMYLSPIKFLYGISSQAGILEASYT